MSRSAVLASRDCADFTASLKLVVASCADSQWLKKPYDPQVPSFCCRAVITPFSVMCFPVDSEFVMQGLEGTYFIV